MGISHQNQPGLQGLDCTHCASKLEMSHKSMVVRLVIVALGSSVLFGCGGRSCDANSVGADLDKAAPRADLVKCNGSPTQTCVCDWTAKRLAFYEKLVDDCGDDDTKKLVELVINTPNPAYGGKTMKAWVDGGCPAESPAEMVAA